MPLDSALKLANKMTVQQNRGATSLSVAHVPLTSAACLAPCDLQELSDLRDLLGHGSDPLARARLQIASIAPRPFRGVELRGAKAAPPKQGLSLRAPNSELATSSYIGGTEPMGSSQPQSHASAS